MICGVLFAGWCLLHPVAIDGDTFYAFTPWGRQSFRLWGIDAAELRDPGGAEAKAHLDRLIHGQVLACETAGPPSFSREVVTCVRALDRIDLACEMVATGDARDWPTYSRGAYERCAP